MNLRIAFLVLASATSLHAQSAFQNLDFESSTLAPPTSDPVPISAALPGWEAYIGTTQQSTVEQNDAAINAPSIDIMGPNMPTSMALPQGFPGILDGKFSAVIQGGLAFGGSLESASIQQTGTIPLGDASLQFKAWAGPTTPPSEWSVSFAGNTLTLYALETTSTYTLYGADISAYAGQIGVLAFTDAGQSAPNFLELDDITFSTSSAPEPNPAILAALGGLIFAIFRRKNALTKP